MGNVIEFKEAITERNTTIMYDLAGVRVFKNGVMVDHIKPEELPHDVSALIKRLFVSWSNYNPKRRN